MAFTYTPSTPTDRDRVRALVGDTVSANHYLEDEDIAIYLSLENGDIFLAAALACEAIAGKLAETSSSYSIGVGGQFSVSKNSGPQAFLAKAKTLRAKAEQSDPFYDASTLDYGTSHDGRDTTYYVGDE